MITIKKGLFTGCLTTLLLSGLVLADGSGSSNVENNLKGFQLGFGFDTGFGVTGRYGKYSGFIGDDGLALDYRLYRMPVEAGIPMNFYVDGGAFVSWDGDLGLRAPVGINMEVVPAWNVYVQAVPSLKLIDDVDVGVDLALGFRYAF